MNKSKQKGNRFEYQIRDILREFDMPVKKIPSSGAGADFKGDLLIDDYYHVECKKRKHGFTRIYNWLEERDILFVGDDYKEPLAIMRLKDFCEFLNLKCYKKC